MRMLRDLARRRLRTGLVTHDPEVGAACDRIIRMRDGVVTHDGRTDEIAA